MLALRQASFSRPSQGSGLSPQKTITEKVPKASKDIPPSNSFIQRRFCPSARNGRRALCMGNILRKARRAQAQRGVRETRTFDGENLLVQGSRHGPHVSKAEASTFKMAFFMHASGASNAELISRMRAMGSIKSGRVADVMTAVDRGLFVPSDEEPYFDVPQPIGYNATISGGEAESL